MKIFLLVLILLSVAFFISAQIKITADVAPMYQVEVKGNQLFIETNMEVFINNKRIYGK